MPKKVQSKFPDKELELLISQYKNLHESVWRCHNVSWQATSIFIPVLFILQGYFVQEFHKISLLQVVMGAFVTLSLVSIWRVMMSMLSNYNKKRTDILKAIEHEIYDQMSGKSLIEYYHLLGEIDISKCENNHIKKLTERQTWTLNKILKLVQHKISKWESKKISKWIWDRILKWTWSKIYNGIVVLIILINMLLIWQKYIMAI